MRHEEVWKFQVSVARTPVSYNILSGLANNASLPITLYAVRIFIGRFSVSATSDFWILERRRVRKLCSTPAILSPIGAGE